MILKQQVSASLIVGQTCLVIVKKAKQRNDPDFNKQGYQFTSLGSFSRIMYNFVSFLDLVVEEY